MQNLSVYQQQSFTARFEWGYEGVETLAPVSDLVVIIDVLSFTTCVDIVVGREGTVFPYRFKDATAADYAAEVGALLAGKRGEPISLSPACLASLEPGSRIVLPSPNGATCSFLAKAHDVTVIAGSLRNASAVARYLNRQHPGGTVSVIACGERWPDSGTLRPAWEDMVAAGAILSELEGRTLSPEAQAAVAVFQSARHNLPALLEACSSGQELIVNGFSQDVALAAAYNASQAVPILNGEGAYQHGCEIPDDVNE